VDLGFHEREVAMKLKLKMWIVVAGSVGVVWVSAASWVAGGGGTWPEDQLLVAADAADSDYFGYSIASNGTTALVGVVYDDEGSYGNAGSVRVFERSAGSWAQVDRLLASDYINSGFFGRSVSMSGDTAAIGSNGISFKRGAAYIFVGGPSVWTEEQKLTAPDAAALDEFGYSIAIDGDTVVVGSRMADHSTLINPGAAYVFTRAGSVWSFEQKLVAGDPGQDDWFGYQVAISGDTVAVTALQHDATGAVYMFTRSGTVWSQQQKLIASDGPDVGNLGICLTLVGDTLAAGANTTDHTAMVNAGAVYVFERSGASWSEVQRLTASDAREEVGFGSSLAVAGDTLLVGAGNDDLYGIENAGSAYLFDRTGGVWTEQQKLVTGEPEQGARLGFTVAVTPEVALVTAPFAEVDVATDAGAVCSYDHAGQLFADGFANGDLSAWSFATGS